MNVYMICGKSSTDRVTSNYGEKTGDLVAASWQIATCTWKRKLRSCMCIAKQQDSFHFASPVGRSLRYGWTGVGISASGRGLRRIAGKRKENRVHMIQYPSCCSSPCRPPPSQGRRGRSGAVRSDEERCPLPVPDSRFRFVGSSRTFWVGGGLLFALDCSRVSLRVTGASGGRGAGKFHGNLGGARRPPHGPRRHGPTRYTPMFTLALAAEAGCHFGDREPDRQKLHHRE